MISTRLGDAAYNANYQAHVQACKEFTASNPDYDPWDTTPDQRAAYDTYVNARVDEILDRLKEQQQ